jgi:Flp pilus assembly pilin Flp
MLTRIQASLIKFFGAVQHDEGADLVEYALILLLLAAGLVATLKGFATSLISLYTTINSSNGWI